MGVSSKRALLIFGNYFSEISMKTFFSILSLIFYTPLSTAQVAEEEQPVVESQSVAAATIPGNQTRSQFNHIISVNFIPLFRLLKN